MVGVSHAPSVVYALSFFIGVVVENFAEQSAFLRKYAAHRQYKVLKNKKKEEKRIRAKLYGFAKNNYEPFILLKKTDSEK